MSGAFESYNAELGDLRQAIEHKLNNEAPRQHGGELTMVLRHVSAGQLTPVVNRATQGYAEECVSRA